MFQGVPSLYPVLSLRECAPAPEKPAKQTAHLATPECRAGANRASPLKILRTRNDAHLYARRVFPYV
jgi:hypothetical protein